jgi:hypothetical protein
MGDGVGSGGEGRMLGREFNYVFFLMENRVR